MNDVYFFRPMLSKTRVSKFRRQTYEHGGGQHLTINKVHAMNIIIRELALENS